MSFNPEKLIGAIKEKKLSNQEIVDLLLEKYNIEITIDTIKSYRRKGGKNTIPSPEKIVALANILGVTSDYLLDNEIIKSKHIPLIGKASCGKPNDYELNGYEPVPVPADMYISGMYAVEAEGDSMSPKINDADIVYCCPIKSIDSGKIVHYWLNGESGIKRYKINEAGTIISLIPINTEHDIITIHHDEPHELHMARVVGKIDKDF